jgi:exopolysaccharide biosynthesis operon protein EpsL
MRAEQKISVLMTARDSVRHPEALGLPAQPTIRLNRPLHRNTAYSCSATSASFNVPLFVLRAGLACCLLYVPPALADEYDVWNFTLSTSVVRDSNLFRLPDNVAPPGISGSSRRSDVAHVASVGLRINKPLSQQQFRLELTESAYRYQTYSFLNFNAFNYRAAWLWHLTPRVSGTLSADQKQFLVPFEDVRGIFQRSVRTTRSRIFSIDGIASGGWHVLLAASEYEQKDSNPITAEQSYRTHRAEGGIKYLARSGSSLTAAYRRIDGTYLNRGLDPVNLLDTEFGERHAELAGEWLATGKSRIRARIASVERRHEHFAQRDFSGVTGDAVYYWTPTGKLRIDLSARRDMTAWWQVSSSYRVSNAVSTTATWQASAKTAVILQVDYTKRDYRGALPGFSGPLREDTERGVNARVEWTPLRSVNIQAGVRHVSRSSNMPEFQFRGNIAEITASLLF